MRTELKRQYILLTSSNQYDEISFDQSGVIYATETHTTLVKGDYGTSYTETKI
jgi:hypothetical protein